MHPPWPARQVSIILFLMALASPTLSPASSCACQHRCTLMLQAYYASKLRKSDRLYGGYGMSLKRHAASLPTSLTRGPNQAGPESIIAQLQSMGAPRGRAMLAAQRTAYVSTETALQFLLKNMDDPLFQDQVRCRHVCIVCVCVCVCVCVHIYVWI
jgi:hypothetical protein